jgi:hypothetical protein
VYCLFDFGVSLCLMFVVCDGIRYNLVRSILFSFVCNRIVNFLLFASFNMNAVAEEVCVCLCEINAK